MKSKAGQKKEQEKGEGPNKDLKPCGFCNERNAKYTCPRCEKGYCSVECYKGKNHSGCSEGFYKQQIVSTLSENGPTEDEKKKISKIINQHYQEMIDSNDAEYYDFVEKISRIDLNNASFEEIWENLDEPSKLEFQQLFGSSYSNTQEGKDIIEQAIQQHLPWWENPQKPSVVLTEDGENDTTTLDKQVDLLETYQNKKEYLQSPAAYRDVKLLSQISNKKAHPSVFNQLMGVILGYVYVYRVFQGEFILFTEDATKLLFATVPHLELKKAPVFRTIEEPIYLGLGFIEKIQPTSFGFAEKILCLSDIEAILSKRDGPLCAISDLFRFTSHIITSCENKLNDTSERNAKTILQTIKKSTRASNRLYYYLSLLNTMLNEDTLKDTNSNHPLSELEFHLNYITMLKKRFEVERASITSPQDKEESQADNIFKVVGDESTEKTCAHPRIVELN